MQLRIHVILIKFPVKLSATKIIYVVDLQHAEVGINYLQLLNEPQMEAWALYNAV